MSFQVKKIVEEGGDLVINDSIMVPKSRIIIAKRDGFCTFTLPKRYYQEAESKFDDAVEIYFNILEDPLTTNNDDLFIELVKLKK